MTAAVQAPLTFTAGCRIVLEENQRVLDAVDATQWDRAGVRILSARKVFAIGGGRSGLAVQMAAMRLMHLGLRVHVAGEVTAPAIGAGDVLIAVSGSGATTAVVDAADTARAVGASVIAVTTAPESELAHRAELTLLLAAADKQDHSGSRTRQYAGTLFEQAVLLAFDALFQSLWSADTQSAERLWERHANIG
ncbi:6-phospho-3-hexuloisomerase [Nocardia bovistercoris]|uniref:SIS domain-containing protein n=1 Tax=Nocardia bovistercoris TaxID=2785916 RepID=A0A931N585_9NOCA|nr:6-phospho-3-hexuloisomerase [Nocardia bovistercoris]MBH0779482.1 SIS domain-containing protein [Nocardia bovistercoris]